MRENRILPAFAVVAASLACWCLPVAAFAQLTSEARSQLETDLHDLTQRLVKFRANHPRDAAKPELDFSVDAEVFLKGLNWALRYDQEFDPKDVPLLQRAVTRARERLTTLEAEQHVWSEKTGRIVRGYVSQVDGSTQPYGLVIPAKYQATQPTRLDVVLHGSMKPSGIAELRFISRIDDGDEAAKPAPEQEFIELHPMGRIENCYRWAGETDVFEAIDDVCRKYAIDRNRIVLRGMSMGASGTWHLGLKHPDYFVALGPYCGYVDTHQFSLTPLPNFVKVGPLPVHQELGLHMLDSIDYAANAGVVPAIACMGEKDIFFQAHVLMGEAFDKEGLKLVNLISPGTGHTIDPVTHQEQLRRIGEYAAKGLDHIPKQLRFVTWTLKYSRCHWLQVLGLKEHYARAELAARILENGTVEIDEPQNITRFAILPPVLHAPYSKLRIGGVEIPLPRSIFRTSTRATLILRNGNHWIASDAGDLSVLPGKRPALQGPIDDAFTTSFICVRGTGQPWNPLVQTYTEASLRRFAYEWSRYFRGEIVIKNDTEVTPDDLQRSNLVVFGDPGSNSWIAKVLPHLPLQWDRETLQVGPDRYPAASHVPALIHPNPLEGGEGHYIVVNSGHTFREQELGLLNYLLFPRWGDWAVLKVGDKAPQNPADALDEEVLRAAYFDENWKVK